MAAHVSSTRVILALAAFLASVSGCSSESSDRSTSRSPVLGGTQASATETDRPANDSLGEVLVSGDVDAAFQPTQVMPYFVGDSMKVELVSADRAYRVILFIPPEIETGTFPIADSFAKAHEGITARFGVLGPRLSQYYESVGGTLTIAEVGQFLTGTFAFTAVNVFAGASITVEGSMGRLNWGVSGP